MPKARKPGDPWYTALYRDPHTLWWAPAIFYFVFVVWLTGVIGPLNAQGALLWATLFAIAVTAGIWLRRPSRE
jgi:hypothetical protein